MVRTRSGLPRSPPGGIPNPNNPETKTLPGLESFTTIDNPILVTEYSDQTIEEPVIKPFFQLLDAMEIDRTPHYIDMLHALDINTESTLKYSMFQDPVILHDILQTTKQIQIRIDVEQTINLITRMMYLCYYIWTF
jgi:hypothetical protein